MQTLPTLEELLNHYEDIPQERLLAWWRAKGGLGSVLDRKILKDKSVYKLLLELWGNLIFPLHEKIRVINSLAILRQEQLEEVIEFFKEEKGKINVLGQSDPRRLQELVLEQSHHNEQMLLHFDQVLPENHHSIIMGLEEIYASNIEGETFFCSHKYKESAETYLCIKRMLDDSPFDDLPWFDHNRAYTTMNLGNALYAIGDYPAAIKAFQSAMKIYEGDFLEGRRELDSNRFRVISNLGTALQSNGDYLAAIKALKKAVDIFEGHSCRDRCDLDPDRALTSMNLGNTLTCIGDYHKAIKAYEKAEKIYESDSLWGRCDLDPDRALTSINLGNALSYIGDYHKAIRAYEKAEKVYGGAFCRNRFDLDPERAGTTMNKGITMMSIGNAPAAIEAFQNAMKIYESDSLWDRCDLDPARALTYMNLANALLSDTNAPAAIEAFQNAMKIYESDSLWDRCDLDPARALTYMNLANALYLISDYSAAIKAYTKAEKILEGDSVGHWLPLNNDRCLLYANTSHLLTDMDAPLAWAKAKSIRLIELLELTPEAGTAGAMEANWQSMRSNFAMFHANWLAFVLKEQAYDHIPRILFAIQGRELASEVLDQLTDDQSLPERVKAYQQLRRRLREMIQRRQGGKSFGGGEIIPFDPDRRSMRYVEEQNNRWEADEEQARAEYQHLHQEMIAARDLAAQEPGYELLQLPYEAFSLEAIQADPNFHPHQALLLLISLGDNQGTLLINKQGAPRWLPISGINELALRTERLANSRPDGLRHYRRNTRDDQQVIDSGQLLSQKEYYRFWPTMIRDLKKKIWAPLQEQLSDIRELIVLPQGVLHQLPLAAGKPDKLDLLFYPGLIFYALQNGLMEKSETAVKHHSESLEAERYAVGLLHFDHRDNPEKFLPGVSKEIEAIQELYQPKNGYCQELTCPAPYPSRPLQIDLLHFSGHGGADPKDQYSTVMSVGKEQTLGCQDLLAGNARVRHAFINACTTGQIRENSQGTPMSLVTGLMRTGTQSVTAVLQPISDKLASRFGLLWHKYWQESKEKDPNLTLSHAQAAFVESFGEQKQFWLRILKDEVEDNCTITPELRDRIIDWFELNEEELAIIDQKIEILRGDDQVDRLLPACLIAVLADRGRFSLDFEQKNLLPDIGDLLFNYRVYGRK